MTFDKEEVLKTLYEDLAYNEFTYDQDYGPDMVDMPFHELDKRLKELVTQAYQAGREEERKRIEPYLYDIKAKLNKLDTIFDHLKETK